jgi:hypothetical protein
VEWIIAFFLVLGGGYWASDIARRRGRNPVPFFLLGLLVPVFGVLVTALIPQAPPGPAPPTVTVVCPRCNGREQVASRDSTFTCWHCGAVNPVRGFTA